MNLFESKFGEVFTVIRPLGDFVLFQLDPMEGTYIEGFGQAYRIDAALLQASHIGAPKV
jgi:putative heme iron utilization protein